MTHQAFGYECLTRQVVYPESPRWHKGRIWFSDVHDYRLKAIDFSGHIETIASVPERPAGLGVRPDGTLMMATALAPCLWSVDDGGTRRAVADVSGVATGLLNDLVVDEDGNTYVGDTGFARHRGEPVAPGRIIRVSSEGHVESVAEGLDFPNGLTISADGRVLSVAETAGQRITQYTIDADGRLTETRVLVTLDFRPDGMCLDANGSLWVAATRAAEFVQYDAAGKCTARVPAKAATAVACMFVGEHRDRLALLSADTTPDHLAQGISHGRIDLIDVLTSGGGLP